MNLFALWMGYAIYFLGGFALLAVLFLLVLRLFFQSYRRAYDVLSLREAVLEWKKAHPDKVKPWQQSN